MCVPTFVEFHSLQPSRGPAYQCLCLHIVGRCQASCLHTVGRCQIFTQIACPLEVFEFNRCLSSKTLRELSCNRAPTSPCLIHAFCGSIPLLHGPALLPSQIAAHAISVDIPKLPWPVGGDFINRTARGFWKPSGFP